MNKLIVRNTLLFNIGVSLSIIASYAIVTFVLTPIQDYFFPSLSNVVSLIFIPSGVRILCMSAFGVSAIFAIFAGELFGNYFFWGIGDLELSSKLAIVTTSAVFISFFLAQSLDVPVFFEETVLRIPKLRHLVLVTIIASTLNGIFSATLLQDFSSYQNGGLIAIFYVIGDVLGAVVFLSSVLYISRKIRSFSNRNQ